MAWRQSPGGSEQHLTRAAAAARTRTQRPGKHLAVHASELVVKPDFQILRRYRRPLLLRLEHTHRPTLEDYVHRATRLGSSRSLNLRIGISSARRYICVPSPACEDQCRTRPSPHSSPQLQAPCMERAPELHHLSRRPVQSAGDRICPPEDHCNTGRRPHVEPFASLSLSLSWRWFHENRTLRGTPFQALRHVRRRERCT